MGAKSVVVINNVVGQERFVMAADDGPVEGVSAVMVSHADGERLRDALAKTKSGETVSVEYKVRAYVRACLLHV